MTTLLDIMDRHGRLHADANGIATTPIPGVMFFRVTAPSGVSHAIARPLVCLVVQGAKQVTMGGRDFPLGAGDSLLITADVPIVSQITKASAAAPYVSLVLELDLAIVAELAREMGPALAGVTDPVRVDPTDGEVAGAALRLLQLLDRPAALPVLQASLIREMHYWLLAGRHGAAIRRLGWPDSHAQRIGRAVALLRAEFAKPLPVNRLAEVAGMSVSTFHQHFRAVTSLSPLQFQKQLRLIEARRLMAAEGASASMAAFAVGYESVPQFTREYGRLFGAPPVRDVKAAREQMRAA
ncbi:AraC family transcriptional regulator [Ancylobacter polymorphus]|uniref:AraC family transcriptional regulator n=1 Tax=Ancylobacter polymorphus TaxID=223390 RepID=A0A9E7A4J3_9HYPH|nr:AraC family transcriptional regulator [Ancylobacter polymorphus]UOK72598.1 AraC family transcriptional regulator [Ancylobacter polymorphus]